MQRAPRQGDRHKSTAEKENAESYPTTHPILAIRVVGRNFGLAPAGSTRTRTFYTLCPKRYLSASSSSSLLENEPPPQSLSFNDNDDESLSLTDHLRRAFFDQGQTDGVLQLLLGGSSSSSSSSRSFLTNCPQISAPTTLIAACVEAANGQKGHANSMVNACLGASLERARRKSEEDDDEVSCLPTAVELLSCLERDWKDTLQPDMLTYALAYTSVAGTVQKAEGTKGENHNNDKKNRVTADEILAKAQRQAKKMAGSSRRKALAAVRRKPVRDASETLDTLRTLLSGGHGDFDILDETNDYLVVNKPAGTVCHHNHVTTAGKIGKKNADVSLVDALVHVNVPLSTINSQAQGLVHRLDRGTSGCIILAKTDHMHALLVAEFFLRQVRKTYRTIVAPAPSQCQGTVDLPVDGRPAKSEFFVLQQRGTDLALVEMQTLTGRKHQVRVHAALGLGAPVLMDAVHRVEDARIPVDIEPLLVGIGTANNRERFFLHATSLEIPRYDVSAVAKTPGFWSDILNLLD